MLWAFTGCVVIAFFYRIVLSTSPLHSTFVQNQRSAQETAWRPLRTLALLQLVFSTAEALKLSRFESWVD